MQHRHIKASPACVLGQMIDFHIGLFAMERPSTSVYSTHALSDFYLSLLDLVGVVGFLTEE